MELKITLIFMSNPRKERLASCARLACCRAPGGVSFSLLLPFVNATAQAGISVASIFE
jgi:hypothetical protein